MFEINVWAVIVAAASSFLLGGLWYSPLLFLNIWCRAQGRTDEERKPHPLRVFGVSFAFCLIAAFAFALFLGPDPVFSTAVLKGLIAGSCFVAASFGVNYQFADRSVTMWLVDGGYHTAQFVIFGFILGLWH